MPTITVQPRVRKFRRGRPKTGVLINKGLRAGRVRKVRRAKFKGSHFLNKVAKRRPKFRRRPR